MYVSNLTIQMDLFSQKVKRSDLEKGDHVYTWRKSIYTHHGIFIGEGKLIHLDKLKWKNSLPDIKLWIRKSSREWSKSVLHRLFQKKGKLYRFKYEASREFLVAKLRGGTCTTARSDRPEEVIHRATYLYENGYLEYDLMNNNCEDFALYCKTGLWSNDIGYQGRSSQANMVHPTKKEDRTENRMQRFATAIPRSCSKRENKDLGVREDVVKVPVEELSSFLFALSFT
ncbi:putative LRAT domain, papain-like cysteine peptidase superfamily [Helianthus annuus]|nr:putative LRAT domain, papain-like cysteine peptidase superfamily [Helianthus annuus]KAJ0609318.1 putative LRAT domain, papain-like cysteine peptidase superfamily [Helianthus annuus]KAJ0769376.1 putative LRAT domain, papain-like cysteine peptidase superfamily [Helianthus annuus]KAJ0937237.1 putative LRAT domain, papain-like cysteine peptidase superfamily [Helianthus annuus]